MASDEKFMFDFRTAWTSEMWRVVSRDTDDEIISEYQCKRITIIGSQMTTSDWEPRYSLHHPKPKPTLWQKVKSWLSTGKFTCQKP